MNARQTLWPPADQTEAAGATRSPFSPNFVFLAAGALTASCLVIVHDVAPRAVLAAYGATADHAVGELAGAVPEPSPFRSTFAATVRELKARSGLTWDQLAGVFGVSRRAVHGWAAGARLNAQNSELLNWLRQTLIDVETPGDLEGTRAALLAAVNEARLDGSSALANPRFESPFDRRSVRDKDERWPDIAGTPIRMVK
jgi:transcriptional regulator with XRE-family HTH domain